MPTPVAPAAFHALEWFDALMNEDVGLQLIAVRKSRAAQLTGIRTLARVHSQMPSKVGHLYELSLTVAAVVRFLSSVQAHVCLQVVISRESLVALFAFKWLFSGMSALVVLKHMLVSETSIADIAHEYLISVLVIVLVFHGLSVIVVGRVDATRDGLAVVA